MPKSMVRFGFRIVEGANSGLCSGGWRVWVTKEDLYITAKSFGDKWKASLHGDAAWQLAVTSEHLRSSSQPVWTAPDRAPWRFRPTAFVDGVRLAFVVGVTRAALCPGTLRSNEHEIPVRDKWDELTSAFIWMTEPGVALGEAGVFGGPLILSSGRQVWLTQNREELDGRADPESPCVGAFVEPLTPEKDDVSAPGFLLRGVRWG